MPDLSRLSCWLIHSGAAGDAVQCEGVAAALGVRSETHVVRPRPPWRWMAPWGPSDPAARFQPPWPDLAIASGRLAIPSICEVARRSGGRTFTVVLKDPRLSPSRFDFVWAPDHDGLGGENVLSTPTAPHRLTREGLDRAAAELAPLLADLPRPLVGVLVGGASRRHHCGFPEMDTLGQALRRLSCEHGVGLAVTTSRRTGSSNEARLAAVLGGLPAWRWDGAGDNPYFGMLGLADVLVVTSDSTNMIGEAAFTGKPVYMARLPRRLFSTSVLSRRIDGFHKRMIELGVARWLDGTLDRWSYNPIDSTPVIAAAIAERFARRRQAEPHAEV